MVRTLCLVLLVAGCGGGGGGYYYIPRDMATKPGNNDGGMAGPNCGDNLQNGQESDVDCGGSQCGQCADGKRCKINGDCQANSCIGGLCGKPMQASCQDGAKNGGETDTDCGGLDCPQCAEGLRCVNNSDCQTGRCAGGRCAPPVMMPNCFDGLLNGAETDVDCGGAQCGKCANGQRCKVANDCTSANCAAGRCAPMAMKKDTGLACAAGTECAGTAPICIMTDANMRTWPGGYCSGSCDPNNNDPDTDENTDCPGTATCIGQANKGNCFSLCSGKGACRVGYSCFFGDNDGICYVSTLSACDPTKNTCPCLRQGFDNVGRCGTACTLPNSCPNGEQCYYLNTTIDSMGQKTGDVLSGLICLKAPAQPAQPNQACTYVNSCTAGYECDYFKGSGARVCKKICKVGTQDCANTGGTCKDGFKLGANFQYGLCY